MTAKKLNPISEFKRLKACYLSRPHDRNGAILYLAELYAVAVENEDNDRFWSAIDSMLTRKTKEKPFADLIEATSDAPAKMRWKYAKVLSIAQNQEIKADDLETFIAKHGGLNGVIESHV